eukprot:TRINITY_DN15252_c0_g1_i7.p4 TRINITY_DN15252_c0_g1~~TRINITY_DN15252_c0_g1_i7.p4  ORF type:complete len:131 (+),score=9.51 TRINITY_DN15252_c0_g1_i7:82-474(+)
MSLLLILASQKLGLQRIGVLTMASLNVSTPFLHIAKISKIFDGCQVSKRSKCLFGLFGILFFVSRIIIFPVTVLKCALIDGFQLEEYRLYYIAINLLLLVLQVMQVMWMIRIVRIMIYGSETKEGTIKLR